MTYAVRARVGAVLAGLAVTAGSGEAAANPSTTRSVAKLQKEIETLREQLAVVKTQLDSAPAAAPGLIEYARLDAEQVFTAAQRVNNVFSISPFGATSASPSTGGALNIENSKATGAGAVIYSNAGAEAAGRLLNVRVENPAFPIAAAQVAYAGASNGLEVVSTSTGTSSNAFSVVSTNPNDTAVGIRGAETGRGTVKITHVGTGNDANAAAVSLLLSGSGTAAQGIYLD